MNFINTVLHFDIQLITLINAYGAWVYALLFTIIFGETALLVLAMLPGDSLLFAVGALAARGMLNVYIIIALLIAAAFLGNILNYAIGSKLGNWLIYRKGHALVNPTYLERTRTFYTKNGGKTLIIGCYIPIIRTFASFVAGIANMHYLKFIIYNAIGVILWVSSITTLSYLFGNIPIVQRNFSLITLAIIFISALPAVINYFASSCAKNPDGKL